MQGLEREERGEEKAPHAQPPRGTLDPTPASTVESWAAAAACRHDGPALTLVTAWFSFHMPTELSRFYRAAVETRTQHTHHNHPQHAQSSTGAATPRRSQHKGRGTGH